MTAAVTPLQAVPFSETRAAVLIAVIHQPRPTVRSVAEYAGVSVETAHRTLSRLRDLGLVEWVAGSRGGTLRPLVTLTLVPGGAR